jgi:hypothetical protein
MIIDQVTERGSFLKVGLSLQSLRSIPLQEMPGIARGPEAGAIDVDG